ILSSLFPYTTLFRSPARLHVDVVELAIGILLGTLAHHRNTWRALALLCVEIERVIRQARYGHVVDIGIERAGFLFAFVRDRKARDRKSTRLNSSHSQ